MKAARHKGPCASNSCRRQDRGRRANAEAPSGATAAARQPRRGEEVRRSSVRLQFATLGLPQRPKVLRGCRRSCGEPTDSEARTRRSLARLACPGSLSRRRWSRVIEHDDRAPRRQSFCLDNAAGGIEALARAWRARRADPLVAAALAHLRDKFATVNSYGPCQVAIFYEATSREEQERHSR
jgi:hypothetical protein